MNLSGRGIGIHAPWRHDFPAFVAHVGSRPSTRHSIDRIDNGRGYEPGNVRWATKQEQSRNRRDRRPVTFCGQTKLLVDWATDTGIKIATLHDRLYKHGWPVERALTTDPRAYHKRQ